ncbi:MAG: hypothetical protein JST00_14385 [Deltaproteobacteria bacterium]|nr:hypothetical protein [Deltaproteobacteria bacterium]
MSGGPKRDSSEQAFAGLDGAWEEVAPPDPALAKTTERPAPPTSGGLVAREPTPFSDVPPPPGLEPVPGAPPPLDLDLDLDLDLGLEPLEPKIDVAAASRAANTAAALGRAPKPRTTTKMNALDLAEALARATALDDDEKKK